MWLTVHSDDDKRFLWLWTHNNWSSNGSWQTSEATCHVGLSLPVKQWATINMHHRACLNASTVLQALCTASTLYSNDVLPCTSIDACDQIWVYTIRSECIMSAICSLFLICTVICHRSAQSSVRTCKNSEIVGLIAVPRPYRSGHVPKWYVPKWTCAEVVQNGFTISVHVILRTEMVYTEVDTTRVGMIYIGDIYRWYISVIYPIFSGLKISDIFDSFHIFSTLLYYLM